MKFLFHESRGVAFWSRWVLANLLGELAGLGIVGMVGYGALLAFGEPTSATHVISFAVLAVGLGAVEGGIVGYAQHVVLRRRLPQLHGWVRATVLGAVIAWALGMLPSTLVSLLGSAHPEEAVEIPDVVQLLLAVPMGLAAGVILALPQWRVLRRRVLHPGWWIPANALAWACGMPLVFVAAGVRPEMNGWWAAFAVVGSLAAAGAVVGAIHGAFLVKLTAPSNVLRSRP